MTIQPTAVALPSEQQRPPSLREQVLRMEHEFALAAPRGMEARQVVRDVLTAISQNPDLLKCEPRSVLGGAMTMAQLGLRVGVLGHGWLLPFWDSRAKWVDDNGRERTGMHKAQLIIGYKGLVSLAYRSGEISKITARTVRANDHFDLSYGLDEHLTHRPATGDRGEPVGYYATVKLKGSGEAMFYHMTHAEMEVYRDRFAMAKRKDGTLVGPWRDSFEGMAHKTCLRQLSKFMPQGTDLAVALAVDDTVRVDVTPTVAPEYVSEHVEAPGPEQTPHVGADTFADGTLPVGGESA